jgi:hypothetical protein
MDMDKLPAIANMLTFPPKRTSPHLLGLLDLGEAAVKDGGLVGEVHAVELRHLALGHQLLRPAVRAVDDHDPDQAAAGALLANPSNTSFATVSP